MRAGADRLQPQLLFVSLFYPLRQVGHPVQNAGGGSGFDQRTRNGRNVVAHPLRRDDVVGQGAEQVMYGSLRRISKFISCFHT